MVKIAHLRKLYPTLSNDVKNIKWRRLTDAELNLSMEQPQIIANCYDEATRYSLLASKKGREILKERIWIQADKTSGRAFKFKLNVNGKNEVYRSTSKDYWGAYSAITEDYYMSDYNDYARLSLGANIAIDKMISNHKTQKPFYSRVFMLGNACEYNKPSNAFRWFTGKTPKTIGETNLNLNLKPYKEEVEKLFDRLANKKSDEYSFVTITGVLPAKIKKHNSGVAQWLNEKYKISSWHCCSVIDVNKNREITIRNPRTKDIIKMSFEEFIKKFKGIVGLEF